MKKIKSRANLILFILLLILIGLTAFYFVFVRGREKENEVFAEAEIARENKQYSKAVSLYKESINVDPSYTNAYINTADILEGKGLYEEAISVLEKGIGYATDDALLYQKIASLYAHNANPEMALETIVKAKEKKNNTSIYHDYLSYLYLNGEFDQVSSLKGDFPGDDAYANYVKAILSYDNLEESLEYAREAQTKSSEYKYQQLYETIKTAYNTEDNTIEDLMLIAVDSINSGEYALTLGPLQLIKEENKYYEGSYIYEAFVYNNYQMYTDAIDSLNTALLYTQNNYQVYKFLAYANYENQDYKTAETNIIQALTFPNLDADTYELAARIFKENEDYKKALDNLNKIETLGNDYEYTKLNLELLLLNKQYEKALAAASSFIENATYTNDQKAVITSLSAWADYSMGNKAQAKEKLLDAEAIYSLSPYTQYYLGLYYLNQDELTSAKTYLENAIDLDMEGYVTPLAQQELNSLKDAGTEE